MSFYKQDVTPFAVDVWLNALQKYDFDSIKNAFNKHAVDPDQGMFSPKPAHIVKILEGNRVDRAMLAWGKVLGAIQSAGSYTDVCFDDPIIHAVIRDMGGWPKVCGVLTNELSFFQHQFTQSYRAYAGSENFDYPKALIGNRSPDDEFIKKGLPVPKPRLIGDKEKAKQVYLSHQKNQPNIGYISVNKMLERSVNA